MGQADRTGEVSTRNRLRVSLRNDTVQTTPQHYYDSGVYHDTFPGDAIGCCDKPRMDPCHVERPPEKLCSCPNLLNGNGHYWSPKSGCPQTWTPDLYEEGKPYVRFP
jgi:hypothetical protein